MNLYLLSVIVFVVFVTSAFFVHTAFATVSEGCGLFEIRAGCDISGWLHIILGDILIGAFLAILLHYLAHRNSLKLEKIIKSQEELRKRRKYYAIHILKNHLTAVLFWFGIIEGLVSNYNEDVANRKGIFALIKGEEGKMGVIIQTAKNSVLYSNDVLDPVLVNELDELFTSVAQISVKESDDKIELPEYKESEKKIMSLAKRLQDYSAPNTKSKQVLQNE